ncbi:DUF2971 domain-containing protein [Providencia sp. PROV196]|uniref:DUF2971 domain-containing protein n=1 Tax=Providencia sp. PROV196 TaxID=2949897 RepID=UPI00234A0750|nr:DUF2971 domain-containing protein [Providencia sp. PROV196]
MSLLYKYTDTKHAFKIIENHSFHWSNPLSFNDPFEFLFVTPTDLNAEARKMAVLTSIGKPLFQSAYFHLTIAGSLASNNKLEHTTGLLLSELQVLMKKHSIGIRKNNTIDYYNQIEKDILNLFLKKKAFKKIVLGHADPSLLSNSVKLIIQEFGVLCLSKSKNNPLMWPHYADSHKGVMFELSEPHFNIDSSICIDTVSYQENIPKLDRSDLLGINSYLFKDNTTDLIKKNIFIKSSEWSYEQEVRLFRAITDENRLLAFPKEAFKSIYLGCRMKEHEKKEIINQIKKHLPNISIFQLEINKTKYQLNSKKIA